MSSILKALKKLENQATDQTHVRFQWHKSHMQNAVHEQIDGHPWFKKSYVIIFTGLVFAVGAGLILNQKLHEKKPELIAKKDAIHQKPVRIPEKKAVIPDKKAIQQKPARIPEKKVTMPDRAQKELFSRKDVKKSEPMATPPSYPKSRRNTAVLSNEKTPPLKQAPKETVTEKRNEKPEQHAKEDRFASMPVKRSNQTGIDLQAIAWSNDPKSRLAVINGLILRERESIDNVIVMHIGKDAVVFKKGREEWKQMFGF